MDDTRISRYREEAVPARDSFTWHMTAPNYPTLGILRGIVDSAVADGVPSDATVQLSGVEVYFFWRRPA